MNDEVLKIDESELEAKIQLNHENRCVSMDCTYLESDKTITIKRKDLPLEYTAFSRKLYDYVYKEGQLKLEPILKPLSFEEKQNEFNIDVDFRLSMLELGLS